MVVERPLAVGGGGTGEIEVHARRGAPGVPTTLTTFGLVRSAASVISAARVAMCGPFREQAQALAHEVRVERRQVALQVDDDSASPSGSTLVQGLENAVGAGCMIGPRHDRLAACGRERPP